jgi:pimeloyl-ACP methyl ester carboxylesterase
METNMSARVVWRIGFLVAAAWAGLAADAALATEDPNTVPQQAALAIHSADYVKIGGIDQWITITGSNARNPVILFVHGGPGQAMSPLSDSIFAGWEKDFTLVQWDQRGAGRTYSRNGKSIEPTMTIERMTEDGIEVAEYLRQHLHKQRILLVAGSWGSILGIRMAHARPDLFLSYVGFGQVTNMQRDLAASYARLLELAQSKGDRKTLDALNALGPPPWHLIAKWYPYRTVLTPYQAEQATAPMPPTGAVAAEYSADFKPGSAWLEADDFSFFHFWGPTLSGPLFGVDLSALTDFKIPIFIVQGEKDLTIPPDVTRAFFETIHAPRKKFYVVRDTGHNLSLAELNLIREILLTQATSLVR